MTRTRQPCIWTQELTFYLLSILLRFCRSILDTGKQNLSKLCTTATVRAWDNGMFNNRTGEWSYRVTMYALNLYIHRVIREWIHPMVE